MIAIYLNTKVKSSNFHSIILKKTLNQHTYIMGLGYAGGRVYDEFFGQFSGRFSVNFFIWSGVFFGNVFGDFSVFF